MRTSVYVPWCMAMSMCTDICMCICKCRLVPRCMSESRYVCMPQSIVCVSDRLYVCMSPSIHPSIHPSMSCPPSLVSLYLWIRLHVCMKVCVAMSLCLFVSMRACYVICVHIYIYTRCIWWYIVLCVHMWLCVIVCDIVFGLLDEKLHDLHSYGGNYYMGAWGPGASARCALTESEVSRICCMWVALQAKLKTRQRHDFMSFSTFDSFRYALQFCERLNEMAWAWPG